MYIRAISERDGEDLWLQNRFKLLPGDVILLFGTSVIVLVKMVISLSQYNRFNNNNHLCISGVFGLDFNLITSKVFVTARLWVGRQTLLRPR